VIELAFVRCSQAFAVLFEEVMLMLFAESIPSIRSQRRLCGASQDSHYSRVDSAVCAARHAQQIFLGMLDHSHAPRNALYHRILPLHLFLHPHRGLVERSYCEHLHRPTNHGHNDCCVQFRVGSSNLCAAPARDLGPSTHPVTQDRVVDCLFPWSAVSATSFSVG
jgi:hypothetical protein